MNENLMSENKLRSVRACKIRAAR